ncbi:WD40 repeat-like protein [Nadsonia fulvescens var. elongata DSM 6958]|uniref:WD40 repeat-like protein n=1 Tax=Nadsonia fulvescens var. elongata DSM 6958 TaxID=857566 RepID=A0A1E3PNG8_9ASCO|nr:WD40 repeat-like protein [Nadsonia fulvescens var. elongata DSM 6958]
MSSRIIQSQEISNDRSYYSYNCYSKTGEIQPQYSWETRSTKPVDPRLDHSRNDANLHIETQGHDYMGLPSPVSDINYPSNPETTSAYWSVPDPSRYLTTIATHETENLIAVGGGGQESNLFLYELQPAISPNESILTHHQTITLPGIHSLNWVSPFHNLGGTNNNNMLATGHNDGFINLVLIPDAYSNESAEILKRYDHLAHLRPSRTTSTRINFFDLTNVNWKSCASSSIISLLSQHIFFWNPSRSDIPVIKQRIKGVSCLNASPSRDGIVALGGSLGISIMDLRVKNSPCLRPKTNNNSASTNVKWSPFDPNVILSTHDDHHIKLWDIRAAGCFADINEHFDVINSIEWSLTTPTEFQSASSDGTVRIWNVNNCDNRNQLATSKPSSTSLTSPKETPIKLADQSIDDLKWLTPTARLSYKRRKSIHLDAERLAIFNEANSKQRYCYNPFNQDQNFNDISNITSYSSFENSSKHTAIKSSSRRFLGLAFAPGLQDYSAMLTIDHSGYFGLHARVHPLPMYTRDDKASLPLGLLDDRRSSSSSSSSSVSQRSTATMDSEYTVEEAAGVTKNSGIHDFDFF